MEESSNGIESCCCPQKEDCLEIRDKEEITYNGEMEFVAAEGHEILSQSDLASDHSSAIFSIGDLEELLNLAVPF